MKTRPTFWFCLLPLAFFLGAFLGAPRAQAATLTLAFDPPTTTAGVTGYKVYGITGATTNLLATLTGVNTTSATVSIATGSWIFYATSTDANAVESQPSNVLPVSAVLPVYQTGITSGVTYSTAQGYLVSFSWLPAPSTLYVTNFVARLTKPDSTVLTNSTTNTTISYFGLVNGPYSFSLSADNFVGQALLATQTFSVVGAPRNLRVK